MKYLNWFGGYSKNIKAANGLETRKIKISLRSCLQTGLEMVKLWPPNGHWQLWAPQNHITKTVWLIFSHGVFHFLFSLTKIK